MARPFCLFVVGLFAIGLPLAGCEKINELSKKVSQSTSNTVEKAKQQVDLAGRMELTLPGPGVLKISACYAALHKLGGTRGSVLRVTSYSDPSGESFPSVLFWAPVAASEPARLVGQRIRGQMFIQTTPDGLVWHSLNSQSVEFAIGSVQQDLLEGRFTAGKLIATDGSAPADITGDVRATIQH